MMTLAKTADELLRRQIDWAKALPFSSEISLHDHTTLLMSTWWVEKCHWKQQRLYFLTNLTILKTLQGRDNALIIPHNPSSSHFRQAWHSDRQFSKFQVESEKPCLNLNHFLAIMSLQKKNWISSKRPSRSTASLHRWTLLTTSSVSWSSSIFSITVSSNTVSSLFKQKF